jgi:hypothetical protein
MSISMQNFTRAMFWMDENKPEFTKVNSSLEEWGNGIRVETSNPFYSIFGVIEHFISSSGHEHHCGFLGEVLLAIMNLQMNKIEIQMRLVTTNFLRAKA